ncbi:MAG TPA: phosphoribosylglycinamide formyltransferase [Gemmatimonadaceae bacterium]|jgi:phosphoribosylglycinamide formyltransferase-1|nr:phosphoribosylglycinamide formyltransferase [Gemmatimonadaceae bacterium]
MKSRIAVLASGGGSNLQAIIDHLDQLGPRRGGDVVLVASNRSDAGALERAARREIPVAVLASAKEPEGAHLDGLLVEHQVDLMVLAGYLKLVPRDVVAKYHGRIVNVHPALLPAFGGPGMYGQRVHHAVIESGARVTGVTAHFVDEQYDRGRIIAQWPVPVFGSDDAGTLAARVLRVEHLLYPRVVDAVAAGRMTLENCGTIGSAFVDARPSFTLLSHDESRLAENIELALGC